MKRTIKTFVLTLLSLMLSTQISLALDKIQPPAADPVELNNDYYLELSIPEERAEEVLVTLTENGSESDLDVEGLLNSTLQLSYFNVLMQQNQLPLKIPMDVPFSLRQKDDTFILHLKAPDYMGVYTSQLEVKTEEGETKPIDLDHETDIVFTAPEGTFAVIHDPADENADIEDPILVTEKAKGFVMDGEVEIRFVVVPTPDAGNGNQNDGQDGLDQNDIPGPSSGGCSLMASVAGNPSVGGLFLAAVALLGGLRFRRNR